MKPNNSSPLRLLVYFLLKGYSEEQACKLANEILRNNKE